MYINIFHALISSWWGGGILLCANPKKKNPDGEGEGPKDDSVWRGVRYLLSEILLLELNKFEFSRPPISAHVHAVSMIRKIKFHETVFER